MLPTVKLKTITLKAVLEILKIKYVEGDLDSWNSRMPGWKRVQGSFDPASLGDSCRDKILVGLVEDTGYCR